MTRALMPIALLAACSSPKANIDRAADRSDKAATAIQAEAGAAQGEIGMAQALDLPRAARDPLSRAAKRQERIGELAGDVRDQVSAVKEALPGVKNIGMAWWAKLALWLAIPASGLLILVKLVPGLLLKWAPWAAVLMPRSKRSLVTLLRKQAQDPTEPTPERNKQAVAAGRVDRQFDALWEHDG